MNHWIARQAALAAAFVILAGSAGLVQAQAVGFTVTPLLRTTLSGDPTKEVIVASGQFEPGGTTGRHTHPGDEYATLLEGTLEILVAGQAPQRVTAGEAYHNARAVIHETRNVGEVVARVISTLVVERGRPLIEPIK